MPKPPQVSGQCTQESVVLSVCLHLLQLLPQPGSEEGGCAVKAVGRQGGCQALATGAVCWAKRWAGGSTQALPAVTHKVTATAGEVALPGAGWFLRAGRHEVVAGASPRDTELLAR